MFMKWLKWLKWLLRGPEQRVWQVKVTVDVERIYWAERYYQACLKLRRAGDEFAAVVISAMQEEVK